MSSLTTTDLALHMGTEPPAQPSASWSARLERALAAGIAAVERRVISDYVDGTLTYPDDIDQAVLIVSHQLFQKGNSGTGTIGVVDASGVIERDADVRRLMGPYVDLAAMFA